MGLSLDVGWGDGKRRPDDGAEDLEDVSPPETDTDPTASGFRSAIASRPYLSVAVGFALLFTTIWLGFFVTTLIPSLATNIWTYRAGAGLVILGGGYKWGYGTRKAVAEQTDELVLVEAGRARRYRGTYEPNKGTAPWFVPDKGIRGWGPFKTREAYQVKEVKEDLAAVRTRGDTSLDDEVIIRLDQGGRADQRMLHVTETDTGKVITVLTGELEAVRGGSETVLRTTIPEIAHEEQLTDLRETLGEAEQRRKTAEQQRDVMRQQRDAALDVADEAEEEKIDRLVGFYERIEEAQSRRRRQNGQASGDDFWEMMDMGGVNDEQ